MKVSLNLLREFGNFDEPAAEIIETIAAKIGEVENVEELGSLYEGVVVGKILKSKPHPDADKLSVNKVDIGQKQPVQVIAGDKSLKEGNNVAYMPPGNIVPVTAGKDDFKLEARKIRGLNSHGMLASEYELKFSSAHEDVLKLDTDKSPGTALSDVYGLDDRVIDVETKVLTHRPDMFGHLGFARELSAALGKKFASPDWYLDRKPKWGKPTSKLNVSLDNKLKDLVPRFTLAAYDGVIVEPSPVQIQSWLMRLGIRPVNNVVDLTNYIMVVSGQPLHAFDWDKVASGKGTAKFVVRHPKKSEKLKLLDDSIIEPHRDSILIANGKEPIGLGGVMGGADTEVDEHTKRVVLEAANFNMYSIRNTSMAHGITGEAVTRFARGQDPDAIASVQRQAQDLMAEWAGAKPASPLIDEYPYPRNTKSVKASADSINRLLGIKATPASMARTLSNAELEVKRTKETLDVTVPTWRPDLNIEADIAEEIGRLNGYSNVEPTRPKRTIQPANLSDLRRLELSIRDTLSGGGASEVLSYSGVPKKLLDYAGQDPEQAYKIRNALSPEVEYMRLSLVPSLLDKVYPNLRLGYSQFALFEMGAVHNKLLIADKLPEEQQVLGFVYAQSKKAKTNGGAAYYMALKYLSYLMDRLGYEFEISNSLNRDAAWLNQAASPYEKTRRAFINVGGQAIGIIGEFSSKTSRNLRLPEKTAGFELQIERLVKSPRPASKYRKLSKFPPVVMDLTLKSSSDLPYGKLYSALSSVDIKGVEIDIRPLQVFTSDKSHKHTSFRLEFNHPGRTLTQKEVNGWLDKMVKAVNKRTDASQV